MITRRQFGHAALGLGASIAGAARSDEPLSAPFILANRRVQMQVRLNGQGPFTFILDSAATFPSIAGRRVKELGLVQRDVRRLTNGVSYPTYGLKELVVGDNVRYPGVTLMEIDDPGLDADGLLPIGLLTDRDSELDFGARTWRLHAKGAAPPPGFELAPTRLEYFGGSDYRRIYAKIDLDGRSIDFLVDTGTPRPLVISHDIGKALGYLDDNRPYCPVLSGGGFDPAHYTARLVRAGRSQFGQSGYRGNLVLVRPLAAGPEPAVMGLPVIQTLNYWIEASRNQVWIQRNGLPPAGAFYSPSGLLLAADRDQVRVVDVGTGSPASAAGVRKGDLIEGLDLRSATAQADARPGTSVTLNIRRGSTSSQVTFKTALYL